MILNSEIQNQVMLDFILRRSKHLDDCIIMTLSLTPHQSVAVGSLCDNVEVDPETGDLWLGCHPNGWKALMFDPKDPPGSEVCQFFPHNKL